MTPPKNEDQRGRGRIPTDAPLKQWTPIAAGNGHRAYCARSMHGYRRRMRSIDGRSKTGLRLLFAARDEGSRNPLAFQAL